MSVQVFLLVLPAHTSGGKLQMHVWSAVLERPNATTYGPYVDSVKVLEANVSTRNRILRSKLDIL